MKAVKKWKACTGKWRDTGIGLQYGAMVYNVFAATVLYFLAQMEIPPEELQREELANVRRLAKGGAAWANASDLWRMGADCGIGRSVHCLAAHCEAAMLRTLYFERWEKPIGDEEASLCGWEKWSEQHDRQVFSAPVV